MNIEAKLSRMLLRVLSFSESPNKDKLIRAYEKLKKIFISPLFTESIVETINELKSNLFYQEFELEKDPEFFKAIIKKADDSLMIPKFLESLSEIKYFRTEREALIRQIFKLQLLFNFENNLKHETGLFYNTYCFDLNKLKELLFSETIKCENLEWFLKSNFFRLVHDSSPSFKTSLDNIFLSLLKNLPATENIDPLKRIIIEEKNRKITNNTKNDKIINIPKRKINHNFFNSVAINSIAKKALVNNYKKFNASPVV